MRQQDRQADIGQHGLGSTAEHEFAQTRMAETAHDEKVCSQLEGFGLQHLPDRLAPARTRVTSATTPLFSRFSTR